MDVTRLVGEPDTLQRFADLGMTIEAGAPEALDRYINSEIAKWANVIQQADIRPAE
jgi:tripartite-type tricarboxylate transporter receptor subunit TctC